MNIIERREAYDRDPEAFAEMYDEDQEELRKRITRARANLRKITVERSLLSKIAQLCADLKVDGHRGELTIIAPRERWRRLKVDVPPMRATSGVCRQCRCDTVCGAMC